MLATHDNVTIPCIKTDNLLNLITTEDIYFSQVILINEGQFFPDLLLFVEDMLSKANHKKIYVCGLDGDFTQNRFGQILDLIPLCDKVSKLTSLCSICKNGTPGIFSKRITSQREQIVVGSDNYIPVCRNCL